MGKKVICIVCGRSVEGGKAANNGRIVALMHGDPENGICSGSGQLGSMDELENLLDHRVKNEICS